MLFAPYVGRRQKERRRSDGFLVGRRLSVGKPEIEGLWRKEETQIPAAGFLEVVT